MKSPSQTVESLTEALCSESTYVTRPPCEQQRGLKLCEIQIYPSSWNKSMSVLSFNQVSWMLIAWNFIFSCAIISRRTTNASYFAFKLCTFKPKILKLPREFFSLSGAVCNEYCCEGVIILNPHSSSGNSKAFSNFKLSTSPWLLKISSVGITQLSVLNLSFAVYVSPISYQSNFD